MNMKKIILITISFFYSSLVYASNQASNPQLSFIIMKEARFKMDFSRLSKNSRIVLLTSQYSYSRLEERQKKILL